MTLRELLDEKAEIEKQIAELAKQAEALQVVADEMLGKGLLELRKLQGKETGTVTMMFEGIEVVETIPKKVEWNQDLLLSYFHRIMASGEKPSNYMRMKLDIPEKMYASFTPEIKAIFDEARTVKAGRATLTFKEGA